MWNSELLLISLLALEFVGCCIKITRRDVTRRVSDTHHRKKYASVKKNRKQKRSVSLNTSNSKDTGTLCICFSNILRDANNCGELGGSNRNITKIVGGAVVHENEIPWQESVKLKMQQKRDDGNISKCRCP